MTKPSLPTSAEVDRRLRIVSELRNLCLSLGRSRPVADADPSWPADQVRPLPEAVQPPAGA